MPAAGGSFDLLKIKADPAAAASKREVLMKRLRVCVFISSVHSHYTTVVALEKAIHIFFIGNLLQGLFIRILT